MNIDELFTELDRLIRFRLVDFRKQLSDTRRHIRKYQVKIIAEKIKEYERIRLQQEKNTQDTFKRFYCNLKNHIISGVLTQDNRSWEETYDKIVADFQQEMDAICRAAFINKEKAQYVQKEDANIKAGNFSFPSKMANQWVQELNQEISTLTEQIQDFLTQPILHNNFDENAQVFTSSPEVNVLENKDYIGLAKFQAKNRKGVIIFDNPYPLFIERDSLNIILYDVAGNTPEQKTDVYQNLSNILGNICFQEMCRNFGKKNLFIHAWIPASRKNISDKGFLTPLSFFQDFYPSGQRFITEYGDRDYDTLFKVVCSPHSNSYHVLIVFYAGDDDRQTLKKTMEAAAVNTSSFLVVCVCEERLLSELRDYQGNRDGANLVTPQDKTTDFKSKSISISPTELAQLICRKICGEDSSSLCFTPSASIQCAGWEKEASADFNMLGLRNLLQPPQKPVAGEIMVEIGTLKGYPYYWKYIGGKIPPNAYVHGLTGTGKSVWVNDFIYSIASRYSPKEAVFYLCGFKGPSDYKDVCNLPHVQFAVFSLSEIRHFYEMMLYDLMKENQDRAKSWSMIEQINKKYQRHFLMDIDGYHAAAKDYPEENLPPRPMVFFIIDEARPLFTYKSFEKLIAPFVNLFTKCRSTGIFLILASQHDKILNRDYNDFISFDLSLDPPRDARDGEYKLYKTVSRFPCGTGPQIFLDTKDKISDDAGKERMTQEFSEKITSIVKKYDSNSPNSSYLHFYFEDGSLPNLNSISNLKAQIQDVLNASTQTCLRFYLGIFFGSHNGEDIKSLREPYAFSLDMLNTLESGKNLLITDDASKDTPTYVSFWMSVMISVLLQKKARVKCHIFDFNNENKKVLQDYLDAIPGTINQNAKVSVSDSIEELLTALFLWENTARNGTEKQEKTFFIVAINLDNLENAFTDYQEAQEKSAEISMPAPAQTTETAPSKYADKDISFSEDTLKKIAEKIKKEKAAAVSSMPAPAQTTETAPPEYSDKDISFSEDALEKIAEKIKKEKLEKVRATTSFGKGNAQDQVGYSGGARMKIQQTKVKQETIESYSDFCKYLSFLLTQIQGSNRNGCFIFLQSSQSIDARILDSAGFNRMRFIGFPTSGRLAGAELRNLPQKGDKDLVKNAGYYYGSNTELINSSSNGYSFQEPFLPIEANALREIAQAIGNM